MVSTRGGARTSGADEPDTSLALRKKPVRKTTATTKSTATKAKSTTSTAAVKPKTTRSKTVQVAEDDTEDELNQPTPPEPVKATRQRTTRVTKDEEPVRKAPARTASKATEKPKTNTKGTVKTTGAATTRTAIAKAGTEGNAKEDTASKAPELKPAQSRATRATRATAAKNKATPLSPKKHTQVSVVAKKSSKATDVKAAPAKGAKPTTRGRPPVRRRQVSDENADIMQLELPSDSERSADLPEKQPKPNPIHLEEEDITMSTRPTTPADSTQQSFDETEEDAQDISDNLGEEENRDTEQEEESEQVSADELFGAKTPMKRCDPQEQIIYSSARKRQLPGDLPASMRTPVRRFAVLGTQQGTPQTQKPYCKPSVPMSGLKSMTVARARDTAMVFPRLQPYQQHDMQDSSMVSETTVQGEGTPVPSHALSTEEGITDLDHEQRDDSAEQDSDTSLLVDDSLVDTSLASVIVGDVVQDTIQDSDQRSAVSNVDEELPTQATEDGEDSEETIIVDKSAHSPAQAESEDDATADGSIVSVLASENSPNLEAGDELEDIQSLATPRPETLVWENIRQDVTIPFNFDSSAMVARSPTKSLSTVVAVENGARPSTGNTLDLSDFMMPNDNRNPTVEEDEELEGSNEGYMTLACADISTALSAPRTPIKLATAEDVSESDPAIDGDMTLCLEESSLTLSVSRSPIKLSTVEDIPEADQAVDGDVTMVINEPSVPGTVKRSPVRLATFEDEDEDDTDAAQGDQTLNLVAPSCPGTARRSPVKLSTIEHVREDETVVGGDVTMMLHNIPSASTPQQPSTPALINETRDSDVTSLDLLEAGTPRYARSTIASRRKSISAVDASELRANAQAMVATPTRANAWFDDMDLSTKKTPRSEARSPSRGPRSTSRPASWLRPSTAFVKTPLASPVKTAERFPGLPAQQSYESLLDNAVDGTPLVLVPAQDTPGERYPGMPSRQTYEAHVQTTHKVAVSATRTPVKTPVATTARTPTTADTKRKTPHDESVEAPTPAPPIAVQERFPGLPSRTTYAAHHAQTAMPPTRFRTPVKQSPAKRPATAHKPTSLRKLALKASTPTRSRTSAQTPLKDQAQTPGQVSMTPHPSAPLKNIVALVDVYTSDGGCASQSFTVLLKRLGAKTTKTFNDRVTHVVFKDGSPKLLQALVIHNKQVAESGSGRGIFCVNSRWVNDCEAQGKRLEEDGEEYKVEVEDFTRLAKRRRKSMEPSSLSNQGGSLVKDRKTSFGRVSIGRGSVVKGLEEGEKENFEDGEEDGEPGTPMYLRDPERLVQQTLPVKRMRDVKVSEEDKRRRLTFMGELEF